jgi:signal recognition particle receptor subunit beta
MVSINYAFREISCKIVYYGPGLSGKTTNLQYVHQKVPGKTRGDLISLATDADRTLYFDFLPINLGAIQGFSTKFQLYTVPGQVYYNATRKLVLRGVDGLVFVADSQRAKMDENLESLKNLYDNLEEYGYDPADLPIVIQYNKRDLPEVMTVAELQAALNPRGLPHFEAVAVNGTGVFDTLKLIIKLVLDKARRQSDLSGTAAGATSEGVRERRAVPAEADPEVKASSSMTYVPPPPGEADDHEPVAVTTGAPANVPASAAQTAPAPARPIVSEDPSRGARPSLTALGTGPARVGGDADTLRDAKESTGPVMRAPGTPLAPAVIPPAPSLRRTSDGRKKPKPSFWRKLFNWI